MTSKIEKINIKNVDRLIITSFTMISVLFAINQVFDLNFLCNIVLFGKTYYFIIIGLLLPLVFLDKQSKKRGYYLWLDNLAFFVLWVAFMYLAYIGYDIVLKGYGYFAPTGLVILSTIVWILIIESVRRTAGITLAVVILFFSLYPIFAGYMPGLFYGIGRSLGKTAVFHILSDESATGLLLSTFTDTLMGYLIFGEVMVFTGGANFLLNISARLMAKTRGGPAKIAVVSSAFFGSISGSPIANVITTGSITIPAMKKIGYKDYYAGAIETIASTGGTLTPPIMGATAFILASFINMPYNKVALGAMIPAIMMYVLLFVQVDGNAARNNIGGGADQIKNVPPTLEILKDGWFYIPALMSLIYFLFISRLVNEAPYLATLVMIILAQIRKKTRMNLQQFLKLFEKLGRNLSNLLAIMIGVGFLLGSFSLTGIASTFARELFQLSCGNVMLMLIITAIASYIMGMGMTTVACYIFLSVIVAPALVQAGLNILAVHLFILYCGMLSYITPPVALAAIVASNIAKASPMKIAITACRLGAALFIIPFFFILEPALVMQDSEVSTIVYRFIITMLAMIFLGSGFEGYLWIIGNISHDYLFRGILIVSSIALAFPSSVISWKVNVIGGAVLLIAFIIKIIAKRLSIDNGKLIKN